MGFRREMENDVGLGLRKQVAHGARVTDIALLELIAGIVRHGLQRIEVAGVGQFIEHDHTGVGLGDQLAHQRRADEPGAAGHHVGAGQWRRHDACSA